MLKTFLTSSILGLAAISASTVAAQEQPDGWYPWFIDWQGKENGDTPVERIVETVYGKDIFYRTALVELDGKEPAEIIVQFNKECSTIVRVPRTDIEGIACAHAILKETSPNYWEPIFDTAAVQSWYAIGPQNMPAGIISDGVYWAWGKDRMEPLNTIDLQFAPPENYSNIPTIFAQTRNRDLQVASIMTDTVQGWLSIETAQSGDMTNWRYADMQGRILARGETKSDDFGIAVSPVSIGAIDIATQPEDGITVTRISVGLTETEWVETLTKGMLPPGWKHTDFSSASRSEGDPNELFDDIDIVEMGSSVQPPIRHASIPANGGSYVISTLVGPICGMDACPVRFGFIPENATQPISNMDVDMPEGMMCQDYRRVYIDVARGVVRACDEEFDLSALRDATF